jgi:hypothetical protein
MPVRRTRAYPLPDDELLLLLEEEGVELVDLSVKEGEELGLRGGSGGEGRRGDGVNAALELLVAQELAAPLRQALFDLLLQPLTELHRRLCR